MDGTITKLYATSREINAMFSLTRQWLLKHEDELVDAGVIISRKSMRGRKRGPVRYHIASIKQFIESGIVRK